MAQQVLTNIKPWYQSWTVIINGVFLVLSIYIQVIQLLMGANILTPLLSIFIPNHPEFVAPLVNEIIQIASIANLLLRLKTKSPIGV